MNQRQQKQRWKRPCRTIVGVGYFSTNKKEKPRPPIPPVKVHGQGIRRQQEEVGQGQRQEGSARAAAASSAASAKASGGGKRLMLPVNKTPTPPHTHERAKRASTYFYPTTSNGRQRPFVPTSAHWVQLTLPHIHVQTSSTQTQPYV